MHRTQAFQSPPLGQGGALPLAAGCVTRQSALGLPEDGRATSGRGVQAPPPRAWVPLRGTAPAQRSRGPPGTCAVLLQSPDLGVQALERAGVLALQE